MTENSSKNSAEGKGPIPTFLNQGYQASPEWLPPPAQPDWSGLPKPPPPIPPQPRTAPSFEPRFRSAQFNYENLVPSIPARNKSSPAASPSTEKDAPVFDFYKVSKSEPPRFPRKDSTKENGHTTGNGSSRVENFNISKVVEREEDVGGPVPEQISVKDSGIGNSKDSTKDDPAPGLKLVSGAGAGLLATDAGGVPGFQTRRKPEYPRRIVEAKSDRIAGAPDQTIVVYTQRPKNEGTSCCCVLQ